jgi:hypothetical protein
MKKSTRDSQDDTKSRVGDCLQPRRESDFDLFARHSEHIPRIEVRGCCSRLFIHVFELTAEGLCFILHLIGCNRGELFFLQVMSFARVLRRQIVWGHFQKTIAFIVVSVSAK